LDAQGWPVEVGTAALTFLRARASFSALTLRAMRFFSLNPLHPPLLSIHPSIHHTQNHKKAAALYALARWLRDWFARLDADAAQLTAAVTLEDPASLARLPAPSLWAEPSKALSVIIPAFNEEARLPRALDEAFR
jgi:hypothetical protein